MTRPTTKADTKKITNTITGVRFRGGGGCLEGWIGEASAVAVEMVGVKVVVVVVAEGGGGRVAVEGVVEGGGEEVG